MLAFVVVLMSARAAADDGLLAAPKWWHAADPTEAPRLKLYNGVELPRVGYGCAGRAPADRARDRRRNQTSRRFFERRERPVEQFERRSTTRNGPGDARR